VHGCAPQDNGPKQDGDPHGGSGNVFNNADLVAFAPFDEIAKGLYGAVEKFGNQNEDRCRQDVKDIEPLPQEKTGQQDQRRKHQFVGNTEIVAYGLKDAREAYLYFAHGMVSIFAGAQKFIAHDANLPLRFKPAGKPGEIKNSAGSAGS
jgi:hypothetical protein